MRNIFRERLNRVASTDIGLKPSEGSTRLVYDLFSPFVASTTISPPIFRTESIPVGALNGNGAFSRILYVVETPVSTEISYQIYRQPLCINTIGAVRVKAVVCAGQYRSHISSVAFKIVEMKAPAPPKILPNSGHFKDQVKVELQRGRETESQVIHYTLDGSTPTVHSNVYHAPFVIQKQGETLIKAKAFRKRRMHGGYAQSRECRRTYQVRSVLYKVSGQCIRLLSLHNA